MGTTRKGIKGPFRGKVGAVIGSRWRGINYMKGLPRAKSTKRPPTPKQAVQRQKFVLLNKLLHRIPGLLDIGFRQFTAAATSVNAAIQYNFDDAFLNDEGNLRLNYPALKFSRGSVYPAGEEKAWRESDGIRVTWHPKTYGVGGSFDDRAYAFAYCPTNDIFMIPAPVMRQEGMAQILYHGVPVGDELHVWLFFSDSFGKRASKTVYIPLSDPPTP